MFIDDPEKRSDGTMRKLAYVKIIWQIKAECSL